MKTHNAPTMTIRGDRVLIDREGIIAEATIRDCRPGHTFTVQFDDGKVVENVSQHELLIEFEDADGIANNGNSYDTLAMELTEENNRFHRFVDRVTRVLDDSVDDSADDGGVDFRESFEKYDVNYDGTITTTDLYSALSSLGISPTLEESKSLKRRFSDAQGNVGYNELFGVLDPTAKLTQRMKPSPVLLDNEMEHLCVSISNAHQKGFSYKDSFDYFDIDGSGVISRSEFANGIAKLGCQLKPKESRMLMRHFEDAATGFIYYKPFVDAIIAYMAEHKFRAHEDDALTRIRNIFQEAHRLGVDFREAFEHFDSDFDGTISIASLEKGFETIDEKLTSEELQLITARFADNSGVLRFRDFISMVDPDARMSRKIMQHSAVENAMKHLCETITTAHENGFSYDETFAFFDADKSGCISRREFFNGITRLGCALERKDARLLMRQFEDTTTGNIQRQAFVNAVVDYIEQHQQHRIAYGTSANAVISRLGLDDARIGKMGIDGAAATGRRNEYAPEQPAQDLSTLLNQLRQTVTNARKRGVELRECFNHFDLDGDASITVQELRTGIVRLGIDISEQQARMITNAYGLTDGRISIRNFVRMISTPAGAASTKSEFVTLPHELRVLVLHIYAGMRMVSNAWDVLRARLNRADSHHAGAVDPDSLGHALQSIGVQLSREDVVTLKRHCADSVTGRVQYEDLITLLKRHGTSMGINELLDKLRAIIQLGVDRGVSLLESFQHFDQFNTGRISVTDFTRGLERLGLKLGASEVTQSLESIFGVDGTMTFNDFLSLVGVARSTTALDSARRVIRLTLAQNSCTREDLHQALVRSGRMAHHHQSVSRHTNDFVTRVELQRVLLDELGVNLGSYSVAQLLNRFDEQGAGLINALEFIEWLYSAEDAHNYHTIASALDKIQAACLHNGLDQALCQRQFSYFDINLDGTVTNSEFTSSIQSLGVNLSNTQTDAIVSFIGSVAPHRVAYSDFLDLVFETTPSSGRNHTTTSADKFGQRMGSSAMADVAVSEKTAELQEFFSTAKAMKVPLRETFRCFDRNRDGTISWPELVAAMVELGFECAESTLRDVMVSMDINCDGQVNYCEFLHFWSGDAARAATAAEETDQRSGNNNNNSGGGGGDVMSEKELAEQVDALKLKLHRYMIDAKRRGISIAKLFARFDHDNDGVLSARELEMALRNLGFAYKTPVFHAFVRQLDLNNDDNIDYREFLGIKAVPVSWAQAFAKQRSLQQKIQTVHFARCLVLGIVRAAEDEITAKGPIWRASRQRSLQRTAKTTFVLRNRMIHAATPARGNKEQRVARRKSEDIVETNKATTAHPCWQRDLEIAEQVHAAEQAATRVLHQENRRREKTALAQSLTNSLARARAAAANALGNALDFETQEHAVRFLNSIGLSKDLGITVSPLGGTNNNSSKGNSWAFALGDANESTTVLHHGKPSRILSRKLRRELMRKLEPTQVPVIADVYFDEWTVADVENFMGTIRVPAQNVMTLGVDGLALAQLSFRDMEHELGVGDKVLQQRLMYQVVLHEKLVGVARWKAATAAGAAMSDIPSSITVHRAITHGMHTVVRPSLRPLRSWNVDEVTQFLLDLGVDHFAVKTFGLDGMGLVELSGQDIEHELGVSNHARQELLESIHQAQEPAYTSLGTGPYLELRADATRMEEDNSARLPMWRDARTGMITLGSGQQHHILVAIQPALQRSMSVATVAFHKQLKRVAQMKTKGMSADKGNMPTGTNETPGVAAMQDVVQVPVVVCEADVLRFIRNAQHAGLQPRVAFVDALQSGFQTDGLPSGDDDRDDVVRSSSEAQLSAVTIGVFSKAMLALGWRRSLASLRAFMWGWQLQQGGIVDVNQVLELSYRFAQVHDELIFGSDMCGAQVALSADGASASALGCLNTRTATTTSHFSPTVSSRVLVRYKGGGSFYPAQVVRAEKMGHFRVRFENFSEREESVPVEWLRPPIVHKDENYLYDTGGEIAKENTRMQNVIDTKNLVLASSAFTAGVHAWFIRIVFVRQSMRIGIMWGSKNLNGETVSRFVGLTSDGSLVGVSAKQAKQFPRVPKCKRDDVVRIRVDMDSFTISFAIQDSPTSKRKSTSISNNNNSSSRGRNSGITAASENNTTVIGPFDLVSSKERARVSLQQRIRILDQQLVETFGSGIDQQCAKIDSKDSGFISFEQWNDLLGRAGCTVNRDVLGDLFAKYVTKTGKFKFRDALNAVLHRDATHARTSFVARPCAELLDRGDCVELVDSSTIDAGTKNSNTGTKENKNNNDNNLQQQQQQGAMAQSTPDDDPGGGGVLAVRARVNVRYGGGFAHYPGEIVARNYKGVGVQATYDVRFGDDGQVYRDVKRANLELVDGNSSADISFAWEQARLAHGSLELRIYSAVLRRIDEDTPETACRGNAVKLGHKQQQKHSSYVGVDDDAPEAISFCDAGDLVPQDLYRRHFAGYRLVPLSDESCVVEPGSSTTSVGTTMSNQDAKFQSPSPTSQALSSNLNQGSFGMDTRLGLGGWRLIGTRDLSIAEEQSIDGVGGHLVHAKADMTATSLAGEIGRYTKTVPLTLRFGPPIDNQQQRKICKYRVCVMGVIGRRKLNGEFAAVKTLVDSSFARNLPARTQVASRKQQQKETAAAVPAEGLAMANNSIMASRFYVLSPAFLAKDRPTSSTRANKEQTPKPVKRTEKRHGPKRSLVRAQRDLVLKQRRNLSHTRATRRVKSPHQEKDDDEEEDKQQEEQPIRQDRIVSSRPSSGATINNSGSSRPVRRLGSPSRDREVLSPQFEARPPFFARVDSRGSPNERQRSRGRSPEGKKYYLKHGSPVQKSSRSPARHGKSPHTTTNSSSIRQQRKRGRSPKVAPLGVQALGLRPTTEIGESLLRMDATELELARLKHQVSTTP